MMLLRERAYIQAATLRARQHSFAASWPMSAHEIRILIELGRMMTSSLLEAMETGSLRGWGPPENMNSPSVVGLPVVRDLCDRCPFSKFPAGEVSSCPHRVRWLATISPFKETP